MARTRYGTDRGLTARMVGTLFGLGLLYVILAAVLYALGVGAIWVLGISAALLFGQWWFSDSMAMAAMRAHVVTPEQAPQLHGLVDRLCAMADMEKPRIAIADNDAPNAFATGRTAKRGVVVVTTGLLRRLDRDELEGVLAHELSHIAHRDVTVMTIASFTAILAGFMVRSAMWGSMMRDRRDQHRPHLLRRDDRERPGLRHLLRPDPCTIALSRTWRRSRGGPRHRSASGAGSRAAENFR